MDSTTADYSWDPLKVASWPVPPADDPDCVDPECDYDHPQIIKVRSKRDHLPHPRHLRSQLLFTVHYCCSLFMARTLDFLLPVRGRDGRLLHDQDDYATDAVCGMQMLNLLFHSSTHLKHNMSGRYF